MRLSRCPCVPEGPSQQSEKTETKSEAPTAPPTPSPDEEETAGHATSSAPLPVDESESGLIFDIRPRVASASGAEGAPEQEGSLEAEKAALPIRCEQVQVNLARGNLSASNSSRDALLSFSDLPPGPYTYTATCTLRGVGTGTAEGRVEVESGELTRVPVTVDMASQAISVDGMQTSGSLQLSVGSPDLKGGNLDDRSRAFVVLADLGYITSSDTHQDIAPLAFTDLGVWSLAAAFTPQRRLTVGGKIAGLAKSPESLDARILQEAGGNLSYALGHELALAAGGSWQAGLDTVKGIVRGGAAVVWRRQQSDFVKTQFSLGGEGVLHRQNSDVGNHSSAFATGSAEVQLCWNFCERRFGATWFGFDAAIPLAHTDKSAAIVGAKPNSALGFHVGSFMRVNDTFDLFANVMWWDRGDAEAVETEFGTLLGGFDQIQMSLGAIFYFSFGKKPPDRDSAYVRTL